MVSKSIKEANIQAQADMEHLVLNTSYVIGSLCPGDREFGYY